MKRPIFISYSSKDAKIAFHLVDYLETHGIECWIAPRNIASGHDYTDTIDEAIKSCNGFILIVSNHSVQSVWVKKELTLGISHQKNIIPFKITNIEINGGINFMLNNLQWIDATSHPSEKFPEVVDGLRRYDSTIVDSRTTVQTSTEDRTAKKHSSKESLSKKILLYGGIATVLVIALLLVIHPWRNEVTETLTADSIPAVIDSASTPKQMVPTTNEIIKPTDSETDRQVDKAKANKERLEKEKAEQERLDKERVEQERIAKEKAEAEKAAAEKAAAEKAAAEKAKEAESSTTPNKINSKAAAAHKKYTKALSLFNAGRYKEALTLFEELKVEGSTESGLDSYINSCRERTK